MTLDDLLDEGGAALLGYVNPDGSGRGNWSGAVAPIRNEAAERLQHWVPEDAETQANFRFRVNEALAAERRVTVERIRMRLTSLNWLEASEYDIRGILDEEAAR